MRSRPTVPDEGALFDGRRFRPAAALPDSLARGEGLFETIRVHDGVPLWTRDHIARLRRSVIALRLDRPPRAALRALEREIARLARRARVREARCRFVWAPPVAHATIHPLAPLEKEEVECVIASWPREGSSPLVRHKTIAWMENGLALRDAEARGAFDALYLDRDGNVLEGARSNVFVARGRTVLTPPLSAPILPGTMRVRVIGWLARRGVRVREAALDLEALLAADEAFLTNALRGVVALSRVDGRRIGTGACGPIACLAREAFERACAREGRRAARAILRSSDRSS